MDPIEDPADAEVQLLNALRVLALPAAEQIALFEPHCVACAIRETFSSWEEEFDDSPFAKGISKTKKMAVGFVRMGEKALYEDQVYPLWNPYVFLGMPSFASGAYNPLIYPPDWPLALLARVVPLPDMTWMLLYYFIGALAMFLLAREWGARQEGALLAMERGLMLANVIEFDQTWGHRNDVPGYVEGLRELDRALPRLLAPVREEDLVIFTADHGNDPTTPSTDHSREIVPVLVVGPRVRPVSIGRRRSFADIGQTVAAFLGVEPLPAGVSFLHEVWSE